MRRSPKRSRADVATPALVRESQGTLTIERIAAGGDGIGRLDGLACFVPRTAPGDRAQVAFIPHARHARGRVLQLLGTSPVRVEPRCHHYLADRCGGCQLQHMTDAAQRDARRHIVRDALRRIGRRTVELPELVSGNSWHYRSRLTLTLLRRGSGWIGGLHPFDDASRVFALTECPIAHSALVAAWSALAPMLRALPDANSLRLALRLVGHEPDSAPHIVLVVDGGTLWPLASEWALRVARAHTPIRAIWWTRAESAPVALMGVTNGEGPVELTERAPFTLPGAHVDDLAPQGNEAVEGLAFAQVNRDVADALHAYVLEQVLAFAPSRVIDGYAGVGLLTASLAQSGVRVTAIESDQAATSRAVHRVGALPLATVVTATMEVGLAAALPADVVVLNPPRRGVEVEVTSLLATAAERGVRGLIYVSCDPATLARDLTRLPGWTISAVRCFDMFPQTAHVETVCVLVPELS